MSVYTKYLEYNLPESNFLAWYEFDDQTDSGPNGNDFSLIEAGGGTFLSVGEANFDDSYITITGVAPTSFTSFFSFKPLASTKAGIILSNNTSGSQGFFLGFTQNGSFFLHCIYGGNFYTRFFNALKIPRASILMFSRFNNTFILSCYHPISKTFESESVFVPSSFDLGTGDLSLGMWDDVSVKTPDFNGSKMIIPEFVVVDVGIQGSIAKLLCNEIFLASNIDNEDFSFKSVSVNRRLGPFSLQRTTGNLEKDTGILLPFSVAESGFSLLTNVPSGNARYFINGEENIPSVFNTYIKFTSQSMSDQVVFDNFNNIVSLESPVALNSYATGIFAKNKAIIFAPNSIYYNGKQILYNNNLLIFGISGSRVIEGQFTFDTNHLCYNSEIIFKGNTNLIEI